MYEECPYRHGPDSDRNAVQDINALRNKTTFKSMEDYLEAISSALALKRKAHSNGEYHLPAVILRLHIRRLRRLEKACKRYDDGELSETVSTASESLDRHTPYPTSPPSRTHAQTTQHRPQSYSVSNEHNHRRNPSPRLSGRSSSRQKSPPGERARGGRRSPTSGHRQRPQSARPGHYKDRAPNRDFIRRSSLKRKQPVDSR